MRFLHQNRVVLAKVTIPSLAMEIEHPRDRVQDGILVNAEFSRDRVYHFRDGVIFVPMNVVNGFVQQEFVEISRMLHGNLASS